MIGSSIRRTRHLADRLRWLLACAVAAAAPAAVCAQQPVPNAELHEGTLRFHGHATIGDFVGSTSTVSGAIVGDTSIATAHGWVEAPVATLRTGNDLRDRDLRASMEAGRYPTIRFVLTGTTLVTSRSDAGRDSVTLLLHGAFTIHGVTRSVALPATVLRTADTTRVLADFPLDLADYRIGGLTKMLGLLRMQRGIEVHVDLRFIEHPAATVTAP